MATLTVYPDADPESTSVDGFAARIVTSESWATIKAGAGTQADDTSANFLNAGFSAAATTNRWAALYRSFLLFDTSALGSGAIITGATLSLYIRAKLDQASNAPTSDIYTSTPASNTAIVAADFTQAGSTSQTGAAKAYAAHTVGAYNDFVFNATGLGNISPTGVSKFAWREAKFDVGSSTPTWGSATTSGIFSAQYAESAGTTQDPKLVITYTAPASLPIPPPNGLRGHLRNTLLTR